jgi:trehalose/maltose transport system permease protein
VINDLSQRIGFTNQNVAFLADPNLAIPSIAAVDIWKTTPYVALLLLAGLQVIPSDVYEAARVDGASAIQQFMQITLPLLRPAIVVTLIFRTLDALRVFDVFFVMFGANRSTQTMAIYDQQTIVSFSRLGYGATISIGIFVIIGIFVVAYATFLKVEQS